MSIFATQNRSRSLISQALLDRFQAPSVEDVSAAINGSVKVVFGAEQTNSTVTGITPNYQTMRNYYLLEGSFITDENLNGNASVVVLGNNVATKLFGQAEGVTGEIIRIEGAPFRVIGVLEKKGGSGFGSEDDVVLIPFTTAQTG